MKIKWNLVKRLAFFGLVFVVTVALGILASSISGNSVTYNWRSIQDLNRWNEWNMIAYIFGSVVIFVPFIISMWRFRSGIPAYNNRKQKRVPLTIGISVILLLLGVALWFVCAGFNPYIPETIYSPYLSLFIVPAFLIIIMILSLVVNGKYGLFDW